MKEPNKDTKVKWMAETLNYLKTKTDKNYTLFTCNAVENSCGGEALRWYRGILLQFLSETFHSDSQLINMFHSEPNQFADDPQSFESRLMWLFMLQTLVQDDQL